MNDVGVAGAMVNGGNGEEARYRRLHARLSWLFLGLVCLQVGLAFVGISLTLHRALGAVVFLAALGLALLAHRGTVAGATRVLAWALPALVVLQLILIALSGPIPPMGDIHGVNAIIILALAFVVAVIAEDTSDPDQTDVL